MLMCHRIEPEVFSAKRAGPPTGGQAGIEANEGE